MSPGKRFLSPLCLLSTTFLPLRFNGPLNVDLKRVPGDFGLLTPTLGHLAPLWQFGSPLSINLTTCPSLTSLSLPFALILSIDGYHHKQILLPR